MQRVKSRVVASGYGDAGASLEKRSLRKFNARSGAPYEDIDFHNATLRQRGRMLYMASPIAAAAINTNRTKIVGTGLKMKSCINSKLLGLSEQAAKEWREKTEREFELWAGGKSFCDVLGANNFYELQSLAVKSWLMSGDVFVILKHVKPTPQNPYSLRLQLVEADRVCTPYTNSGGAYNYTEGKAKNGNLIHDGIEVDGDGRVVAYHICNGYPGTYSPRSHEWRRVEAVGKNSGIPNVLQIMDAERPDQYRGVTFLAPVIEMLLQQRRYTESELTAAIIQTYFTTFVTSDADSSEFPFLEHNEEDSEGERETVQLGPGEIVELQPGEHVSFGNPSIPTAGFDVFNATITKQVGAALELPYDVLIKEFNSSYSASKGALEEAWETFKMRRAWFVSDFCKPVYEAWLAEAVARGRISAPGFFQDPVIRAAWSGTRWDGPAQTHLDPLGEAKANAIILIYQRNISKKYLKNKGKCDIIKIWKKN